MTRELTPQQRHIGVVLVVAAAVLIAIGAVLAYQTREDADAERNYQACVEREQAAFDKGERLVPPEEYCDTMLDR